MTGEQYRIRYVTDDHLPAGKLWAICRKDDHTVLYIAASVRKLSDEDNANVLENVWAGYRELAGIPQQRLPEREVLVVNVG